MIKVTFQSNSYTEQSPVIRHVGPGYNGLNYRWCEQSATDKRYDLRQGTCDREDLPEAIAAICDAYDGAFYACEWPK